MTVAIFGYGSLVNEATHRTPVLATVSARLHGWRRVWRARPPGGDATRDRLALLSVEPHEGAAIDGVLMLDRDESLPDLDRREGHYDRVPLERDAVELLEDHAALAPDTPFFVYVARPVAGTAPGMMLRSYMDAVLQGYERRFGPGAAEAFLRSTAGASELLEDDPPIYPRAVVISDDERERYRALTRTLYPPRSVAMPADAAGSEFE